MQILERARLGSLSGQFHVSGEMYTRLCNAMKDTIVGSMAKHPFTGPMEQELKDRFEKLEAWVLILRHEFKWSVPRIIDHLDDALSGELDGNKFDPDKADGSGLWVARRS